MEWSNAPRLIAACTQEIGVGAKAEWKGSK